MRDEMDKKLWNYAFSILLSAILLLLLGIFVHLDSNNNVNGKPLGPGIISEETRVQEEGIQDKEVPFLYEIFSKKDEELQLFHQFTKDRRLGIGSNPKVAII